MGARAFGQEYLCEFRQMEGAVFDIDLVQRALNDDIPPLEL